MGAIPSEYLMDQYIAGWFWRRVLDGPFLFSLHGENNFMKKATLRLLPNTRIWMLISVDQVTLVAGMPGQV